MAQAVRVPSKTGAGWTMGFLAGIGAGIVAGLASVAVSLVGGRVPPPIASWWSALVAGVAGGLLYVWLTRMTRRPAAAFWIITLVIATIDSLLIALLPLPSGGGTVLGIPLFGLVVPLKQLGAIIGLGHFSARHFPARFLATDAGMHYVTAVVVSLLVPRWVGTRA